MVQGIAEFNGEHCPSFLVSRYSNPTLVIYHST
jgi:hypothetical protein